MTHSDLTIYARPTGCLYLLIAVSGFFSILWVPSQLVVPLDPVATAQNIQQNRSLVAWGVLGDTVMMTAEVLVSVMLFMMFRARGTVLALAAMVSRLMMAAVMAAMLLVHAAVLGLSDPGTKLTSFSLVQRAELAQLFREAHASGVWVWQVFFALHLVLLGLLVARSQAFPRGMGVALALGGLGYLVDSVRAFAFPEAPLLPQLGLGLLLIATVAELSFAVVLCLRRSNRPRMRAQQV